MNTRPWQRNQPLFQAGIGRQRTKNDSITPMKKPFRPSLFLLPASLFILILSGCGEQQPNSYQGYVEGEYLLVSSPIGGRLESLSVARGMTVAADHPLFALDRTVETAAEAEAKQQLHQAENRLADISKGLRPSEIDVIKAQREQARATFDLAKREYARRELLLQQKAIAKEELDRTRTEMERSGAVIAQLDAELETARLGARPDALAAARAEVEAAGQRLAQAAWSLEQKTQTAPRGGLVFDTFYTEGEFVPAAYPVVSLLPPGNVSIRFFVPEPVVGTLKPGQNVSISFDGAQKPVPAAISYISPQAEYTPPIRGSQCPGKPEFHGPGLRNQGPAANG